MKKKRIQISSAKNKARRLQKIIAQDIAALLNVKVGKDEVVASREMSQTGVDVRIVGEEYRRKFPFAVECKWQEKWCIPLWIKEAESKLNNKEDTKGFLTWLLFFKRNRSPIYVLLEKDVFFKIIKHLDVEKFIEEMQNESK